jgi:hypothetical protein
MAVRGKRAPGAGQARTGRWPRRGARALASGSVAAVLSVSCAACGSSFAGTLTVSVTSGPPGTMVSVSGTAGSGCVVDTNWYGFDFERDGKLTTGPATEMTTPIATNGSWSATFDIPSYLGGSATRGPGAPVTPGRYRFAAETCKSHKSPTASFRVTSGTTVSAKDYVAIAVTPDGHGYWLAQADGDVSAFGDAHAYGSLGANQLAPGQRIVGVARTYDAHGYWLAATDGTIYTFGDARSYGSPVTAHKALPAPITGIASTPLGKGYWLVCANGKVFGFGDADVSGEPNTYLAPYDAIGQRPGGGYVVTAADDGGVYVYPGGLLSAYGPGAAQSATFVGTAVTPSGNGTWQVGTDGGVFTSGDAKYFGSVPGENVVLKAPITAMAATPDGLGYWLVGANGTLFPFGDAAALAPAAG